MSSCSYRFKSSFDARILECYLVEKDGKQEHYKARLLVGFFEQGHSKIGAYYVKRTSLILRAMQKLKPAIQCELVLGKTDEKIAKKALINGYNHWNNQIR